MPGISENLAVFVDTNVCVHVLNNRNEHSTCGIKPTLKTSNRSAAPCPMPSLKLCQLLRILMKYGHFSKMDAS